MYTIFVWWPLGLLAWLIFSVLLLFIKLTSRNCAKKEKKQSVNDLNNKMIQY